MSGFARAVDMEPGMGFFDGPRGGLLFFAGVARVTSRFPGKSRVRVFAEGGVSFVAERETRFMLWGGQEWMS